MRRARQCAHVVLLTGAEVDVRQQQRTDTVVQRIVQLAACHGAHFTAVEQCCHAARDIQIGWKVVVLGEDHGALWVRAQCCPEQLEETHRRAVCHEHLVLGGTQEARQLGADAVRRVHPRRLGPASHQAARPFMADQLVDAGARRARHPAERVAVEIDDVVIDVEPVAKRRQRVVVVELLTQRAIDDLGQHDGHNSARTSHSSGKKRRSTVERR